MAHHKQWDVLKQFRLVLREDKFLEGCEHAVSENVASLVSAEEGTFVLVEELDPLLEVGE